MKMDHSVPVRLNQLLLSAGLPEMDADLGSRFQVYLELLVRWNARLNLTAIRDQEGILARHFVESIACARAIPAGSAALLDFGSGAGFPGIPIALCRPEISVTLAESQAKKAAFLHEAVRRLGLHAKVYAGRAETLGAVFDCVAMRAVDRMEDAANAASRLLAPGGWLILMTTGPEAASLKSAAGKDFRWEHSIPLPMSEERIIALGKRSD
jgi:16S rRNA (guanine527-N7)-methyltransferase